MKHFLMLAALLAGTFCMADNLLVNGDMKTNKGWSIWGSAPKDKAIRAKLLTYVNEGPNGERVLKFEDCCTDFNPYLIQFAPVSDVTAETQFKLTFSLKAEKGQVVPITLQMSAPDPDKPGKTKYAGACASKGRIVGTGEWKQYEMSFSKPKPGLAKVGVAFYPVAKPWGEENRKLTGSFLLADVSLEQVK